MENPLIYETAHRAGWDAGNHSMQAAGREHWAAEDWDVATKEFYCVLRAFERPAKGC